MRPLALALLLALPLAAQETPPRPRPVPTKPKPLSRESLRSAEYGSPLMVTGRARLASGVYTEGDHTVKLLDPMATADLDGDGSPEALVLLSGQAGKRSYVELAVVVERNGGPHHLASFALGEGVKPEKIAVKDGVVSVILLVPGPRDPACCPTVRTVKRFRLERDRLIAAP